MDYTLKGLGLFGVALVSGILWFLTHNEAPVQTQNPRQQTSRPASTPSPPTWPPDRRRLRHPRHQPGVQAFLQSHQCVSLTRSLWTATLPDGDHVLTSVAVVKMPSAARPPNSTRSSSDSASGHVKDQVEEGYPVPNGPSTLEAGGYESKVDGSEDVIVVTEFLNGAEDKDLDKQQAAKKELYAVSKDALNQAIGR